MLTDTLIDNRWLLLERIGAGGGGRVYRVQDLRDGSFAAMKLIRLTKPIERVRLRREIQAMRLVSAPGVVRLFDVGQYLDEPYIVMELIDGVPFPGPQPRGDWRGLCRMVERLCDVLIHVHSAAIVHRDLKPENVLVGRDGTVTVLDFGLSRGGELEATMTADGVVGAPRFLAPEQLAGQRVDGRADLYALGVMMWEALAGRQIFSNRVAWTRMTKRGGPPPDRLDGLAADTPQALVALVHRLLATGPHDRPSGAVEVLRVLASVQAGDGPVFAPPLPLVGRDELQKTLLDFAAAGRSVDVWGGPGTGKTALLQAVAQGLQAQGKSVLSVGRGSRGLESLVPILGPPRRPPAHWRRWRDGWVSGFRVGTCSSSTTSP